MQPQRPQHLIKHQEYVLHAFFAFCLPEIPPELTPWCVDMSPSGEIPTFGGKIPCISTSHEPPFAPSDPSTGYNINNMSLMDSVYSAAHKSLGNGLQWARIFPILA